MMLTGMFLPCPVFTRVTSPVGFLDEARMSKKMIKIKKKLVSLEMERCQKKIEHKDLTKIDQKIQEQKQLFEDCCNQRSGG